ncbi:DUF6265 family protein [Tenacibaculum agarivorans]|uniref:DUF6265 family protein n=1 Tax=Tenacibaculum agarivorans TaxID=1908389 RepID=UPI00094BB918|nr:DUF6265 family protein [Tenacibaculum agarivorans]
MRHLILLLAAFSILSCKKEIQNPKFLIGKWKRVNDEPSKSTYEFWNENYSGLGFTLQNKDTVFREDLSIVSINGVKQFQVTGVNENPTLFKITELSNTSFTCENPDNDFPKKITYWLEEEKLHAKVANDEFAIDFEFERME